MNSEDCDFITNIANSTALDLINKLKKASEYFREDPECVGKCMMLHHLTIISLLADYLSAMSQMSDLEEEQVFAILLQDTKRTMERYGNQ